ncbi:MAG: hypothetical protein IPI49_17120 [Myxococcales bacterium]|nr:hypothetical protein [Myxococcales bacterium]
MSLSLGTLASSVIQPRRASLILAAMATGLLVLPGLLDVRTVPIRRQAESPPAPTPAPAAPAVATAPAASQPTPGPEAAPLPSPAERPQLWLMTSVFDHGYLQLEVLPQDSALPDHGPATTGENDGGRAYLAPLLPTAAPAWRGIIGQLVVTDSGCQARVTSLALVARLTGDAAYAGLSHDFTPDDLRDQGGRMIAARLDGCAHDRYAHPAAAPVLRPEPLVRPALARAARRAMLASPTTTAAIAKWTEAALAGTWQEQVRWSEQVLRHPRTKATWVLSHAHLSPEDCGTPTFSLLGVFRVGDDGALTEASITELEDLLTIDAIVDVDGDGQFELLGTPWLGLDRVLTRSDGTELDRLSLPFYGCPC